MGFQIYRAQEHELIERCKASDSQAQEIVFQKYSGKMNAVCRRYIRDKMASEDALVMSFSKIFERIGQFKGEGSFEGWIRRIVVNECLNYLRKNKNMYLEADIESADHHPDYKQLENSLEAEDLLKMIGELPTGYGMVFNMYAIDGYSHKEIAEQLGINENTSKSQLSRARAFLQRALLEHEEQLKRTENNR